MKRQILFAVVLASALSTIFSGCQLSDVVIRILGIDKVGPNWIEIQVSAGTKPTFSWKYGPAMLIYVCLADSALPAGILWAAKTPERNGIHPPVTYGDNIDGAVVTYSKYYHPDLEKGKKYGVRVTTWGPTATGYKEFIP